jgi:hypothetical protein
LYVRLSVNDYALYFTSHPYTPRDTQTTKLLQGRRRIVRMLISVVATFAILWMPYHVTNIYLDLNPGATQRATVAMYVYPICQWFGLLNSSSNPVCFCFFSKSFRWVHTFAKYQCHYLHDNIYFILLTMFQTGFIIHENVFSMNSKETFCIPFHRSNVCGYLKK